MNLALRFDRYSDFGSTFNPRVGLIYKLSKNLILRSSFSTGFRAPSLFELFSDKNQGFSSVVDELKCNQADIDGDGTIDRQQAGFEFNSSHPCQAIRIQTITQGNSQLEAETSTALTLGTVYQPNKRLRLSFSFYSQEFDDQILRLPTDEVAKREARFGSDARISRNNNGIIQSMALSYDNFSGVKTSGIDFELNHMVFNNIGRWSYFVNASGIVKYEVELIKGEGFSSIEGDAGTPEGRAEFGIDWQRKNLDARLKFNYIPSSRDGSVNFASQLLVDLHMNWQTPWQGLFSLGMINLLNTKPPVDVNMGFPYYDSSMYSLQGRVPYIKYSHTF